MNLDSIDVARQNLRRANVDEVPLAKDQHAESGSRSGITLELSMSEDNYDRLQALQQIGNFGSISELLSEAFRVLEWAVEQQGTGKKVGSTFNAELLEEQIDLHRFRDSGRSR